MGKLELNKKKKKDLIKKNKILSHKCDDIYILNGFSSLQIQKQKVKIFYLDFLLNFFIITYFFVNLFHRNVYIAVSSTTIYRKKDSDFRLPFNQNS